MIQWYPGHMARATKELEKDLKIVDLVVEVRDARIPASSSNPELNELLTGQERLVVLNKVDLACEKETDKWLEYIRKKYTAVKVNALQGQGLKQLLKKIDDCARGINKDVMQKGRNQRDLRVMIIGIPNVGKSALINLMAGRNISKTGGKPGVTRGRQWINVGTKIQLLDTPGILWPRINDEDTAYKLALTGAIKDKIYDEELAAYKLIEYLQEIDQDLISDAYNLEDEIAKQPYDILPLIGRKSGCFMSGGKIDRQRTAVKLINDFRKGKLALVTLEKVEMES